MAPTASDRRLVVISNRLPVVLSQGHDGTWQCTSATGGLVTALTPVLRQRGGVWVGWPGITEEALGDVDHLLAKVSEDSGFLIRPVTLSEQERDRFYFGFSNEVIWPLFHDFTSHCNFDVDYWEAYQSVNRRYAAVVAENTSDRDFIWVHDYQLINVAKELREMGSESRIGFFLHIPFPPPDIFFKLPWRSETLRALLEFDLIGLQTPRDTRNLLQCVRALLPDLRIHGKGAMRFASYRGREVGFGAFPISIDSDSFSQQAATAGVAEWSAALREERSNRQMILGVDRLDYTKGIPNKLEGFRNALTRYPNLHNCVTLLQIVVPSREDIPKYHYLKAEIERLVGEINGQFTQPGWVPIHYIFRHLEFEELLAFYRTAEIALITPLKDGMNLVAKEYCAASLEGDSVLVLSEFAGAAYQLRRGALLVNPYDTAGVADALQLAFSMPEEDRRARMRRLQRSIRENNVFRWVDSYLAAASL